MNAGLRHIRTAATLRAALGRLDDLAPEDADEDIITPDQALESAQHDLAATPYTVAHWLGEACDEATYPLDAYALQQAQAGGERALTVPELLALVMCGCDRDALRARHALRERFDADNLPFARADAARIIAEQEREIQGYAEDSLLARAA